MNAIDRVLINTDAKSVSMNAAVLTFLIVKELNSLQYSSNATLFH